MPQVVTSPMSHAGLPASLYAKKTAGVMDAPPRAEGRPTGSTNQTYRQGGRAIICSVPASRSGSPGQRQLAGDPIRISMQHPPESRIGEPAPELADCREQPAAGRL